MNKKNQLTLSLMALIVVVMITAAKTKQIEASFNGNWELDSSKSDITGISQGNTLPVSVKLLKTDAEVSFERIFNSMPDPSKQTLKLNGTELVTKKENVEGSRSLSISEDKMVLTVRSKTKELRAEGGPLEYARTETYQLAKDGKSLELTRVLAYPDTTETAKGVYNKITN